MKDTKTEIGFTYKGVEYTLGFTASALKQMEREGFKFAKMDEMVLNAPAELFCGAFIAHHKNVPRKLRLEIYDQLCSQSSESEENLTDVLGTMLAEAIEELNSHQGNVEWRVLK